MRDIHDMKVSLPATLLVHGGALGLAFGVGMALTGQEPTLAWLGLALAGAVALALGALQRAPSQRSAYRQYLRAQADQDLLSLDRKRFDAASLAMVTQELERRRPSSKK